VLLFHPVVELQSQERKGAEAPCAVSATYSASYLKLREFSFNFNGVPKMQMKRSSRKQMVIN